MTEPQGAPDASTDNSTDADGAPETTDKGFPANTPVAEMTPEQQAAYWKDKARKHEDAVKKLGNVNELKAAAAELEQIKAARKTEQQKLAERAEAAEKKAAEAELRMLRREVAEEKGIPLKQADRLRGTTREEIEADAEEFAPYVKSGEKKRTVPDLDQGAGNGGTAKPTESAGRDLFVQRHKPQTITT